MDKTAYVEQCNLKYAYIQESGKGGNRNLLTKLTKDWKNGRFTAQRADCVCLCILVILLFVVVIVILFYNQLQKFGNNLVKLTRRRGACLTDGAEFREVTAVERIREPLLEPFPAARPELLTERATRQRDARAVLVAAWAARRLQYLAHELERQPVTFGVHHFPADKLDVNISGGSSTFSTMYNNACDNSWDGNLYHPVNTLPLHSQVGNW